MPADSDEVEKVAAPPVSAAVPSGVLPSLKVTVPVVGYPPNDVTVAIKSTEFPYEEGFALELKVVEVAIGFTVCWNPQTYFQYECPLRYKQL